MDEPPFERIPPEWFERLCVDLATAVEGIAFRLYAKPGQRDEGIDMYGRGSDGGYVAWQVKRRANLTASAFSHAVDDAATGVLPFVVSRFVVAGSFDDRDRRLLDALERSRQQHPTLELDLLGRGQITQRLLRHPALIAKYLGPEWVDYLDARAATHTTVSRPVMDWPAELLGVHPAIAGRYRRRSSAGFVLPEYVDRAHDAELREQLRRISEQGTSALVVIRGGSCTGKTRTAYEGVRHALSTWTLHQPIDVPSLIRELDDHVSGPNSVLWLDDLQTYLADTRAEELAASLRRHLQRPGPLVVLATIWPEAHERLSGATSSPTTGRRQSEALLRSGITIDVPASFPPDVLARARTLRDASLDDALRAADSGEVCQTLAAGPDLLHRWQQGTSTYARALISAAVDARRHRLAAALPVSFLRDAAPGYLTAIERAEASAGWFEEAMMFASETVRGVAAPFSLVPRTSGIGAEAGVVKLADYLEQQGTTMRDRLLPPVSFWDAVLTHVHEPDVCAAVGWTAERREYFRIAATLFRRAAEQGHLDAAHSLAWRLQQAGHKDEADNWLRSTAAVGHTLSVQSVEFEGERSKKNVYHATVPMWKVAAERGDLFAIGRLAWSLEHSGQFDEAELWWRRGANLGDEHCVESLARRLARKGDDAHAEELLRQLIDRGEDVALWELIDLLIRTGREEQVRAEWEQGFNKGCGWSPVFGGGDVDIEVICGLPVWDWLHELADAGNTLAMRSIARRLLPDPFEEDEEDDPPDDKTLEYAKRYLIAAVEAGDAEAQAELDRVPYSRAELDDAAAASDLRAILELADRLERDGSPEAERWWREGVTANNDWAVTRLGALLGSQGRPVVGDDAIESAARVGLRSAHLVLAETLESEGRLPDAEAHLLDSDAEYGSHLPLLEFLHRQGRLRECEFRARNLIQLGSYWHGDTERAHELLDAILRSSGRASEADRVRLFGFEPDGSTAEAW